MIKKTIFLCIGIVSVLCSKAQNDTSRSKNLKEITVIAERINTYNIGGKIERPDSFLKVFYSGNSLAELMDVASGLNIRSYGPGILATSSLRGGSAQQTNLIWNGLNINNQATGLLDLNLIPAFLFENVNVLPGLSAGIQGSGSIGGGIQLHENTNKNKPSIQLLQTFGSFNNLSHGFKFNTSYKNLQNQTKWFYQQADNNFPFQNNAEYGNPIQRLNNANFKTFSILQENTFTTQKAGQFKLSWWGTIANRQIPPTMLMAISTAKQEDISHKIIFNWNKLLNKTVLKLKVLGQNEKLIYQDNDQNINSNFNIHCLTTELEARFKTFANSQSSVGITQFLASALSSEYAKNPKRSQTSIWMNHSQEFKIISTKININMRQDFVDSKFIPFIPGIGFRTRLSKSFDIFGQINRLYRIPTLNDLYWNPGGNPALKPETGYGYEMSLEWRNNNKRSSMNFQLTGYSRTVTNWIQWQPLTPQIWTPINIGEVQNKGCEVRIKSNHRFTKNILANFGINMDFSISKNINEVDINYGKQLIYIPFYKYSAFAGIMVGKTSFMINGIVTGKRYTTPDNAENLPTFYLVNIGIKRDWVIKTVSGNLFFKINNLLNYRYETIVWRPMPGINFELGATLDLNFKKTKT